MNWLTNLFAEGDKKAVKLNEKSVVKDEGQDPNAPVTDEDDLEIEDYREMMKDAQVKASVNLKMIARSATGWEIKPASELPLDVEVAEFVEDVLDQMLGTVDGFLRNAMLAMAYKMSVHELVFRLIEEGRWKGKIGLRAVKVKKAEKFRIATDKFGNLTALEQKSGFDWKKLDPEYFVLWAYGHEGDYVGKSELQAAYKWFIAKGFIHKMWNVYIEKYASPTPVAKYPANTNPDDKKALAKFLTTIHSRKSAVIPEGWDLQLLESARSGGDFESAIGYCDRMISRSLLLPQLMFDEGSSGSYSLGAIHAETFEMVLESLGREIESDIVGDQIIRRIVKMNYTVEAFPKFEFKKKTDANFETTSKGLAVLVNAGIADPDETFVRQKAGLPARTEDQKKAAAKKAEDGSGDAPVAAAPAAKPKAAPKPAKSAAKRSVDAKGANDTGFVEDGLDRQQGASAIELLTFAEKVDFAQIGENLTGIEETLESAAAESIRGLHQGILSELRAGKIVQKQDFPALNKMKIKGAGDIRAALNNAFADAIHQGAFDMKTEINRGLVSVGGESIPKLGANDGHNLSDAATNAIEFSVEGTVEHWKGKIPIQRKLLAEYSRQSFTITGVARDELLEGSKVIIRRGMIRGASYAEIQESLDRLFEPYYGTAVDGKVAAGYRLHNIARTNIAEAYNSGRMNLYKHKDVVGFVKAFQYSAVLDDRTTEFCREWHGAIVKEGSVAASQIVPPNHYQCRGFMIPIVAGEHFTEGYFDNSGGWIEGKTPDAIPALGFRA
jgi:SPP1 gp7 family putative phage head morphogenesis protein